jgi:CRP-like cAMP-binding protein
LDFAKPQPDLRAMEDLDFTSPQPANPAAAAQSAPIKAATSPFYDRAVAEKVFRAWGRAERIAAGTTLFAEDQAPSSGAFFARGAASRMYYLAEGSVALGAGGRLLDTVGAGEVFGEMAVISDSPRSATAVARTDCAAYSMSADELGVALGRMPEFAMMLMSVIFDRLRLTTARLAARKSAVAARPDEPPVFGSEMLRDLVATLPRTATARYAPGAVVMREGQTGAYMYVVQRGSVAIAARDRLVAVVHPGGTFGEMALVDQSPRSATATTQAECELLYIDRAALAEAIRAKPAFAIAMLRAFAQRLRNMNALLA